MTRNGFATECDRGAITLDVFPKDGTKVFYFWSWCVTGCLKYQILKHMYKGEKVKADIMPKGVVVISFP